VPVRSTDARYSLQAERFEEAIRSGSVIATTDAPAFRLHVSAVQCGMADRARSSESVKQRRRNRLSESRRATDAGVGSDDDDYLERAFKDPGID